MHILSPAMDMSVDPSCQQTIPVADYRFGSWRIAISRQPKLQGDLAQQYDAASDKWHRIAHRYALDAAYRRALLAAGAADALEKIVSKANVLDCGIGTGVLATALSRLLTKPPNVCGIDLSERMLAKADIEMRHTGVVPDLRKADIRAIPYADATFDVVMAAHVLEHLPNPQQALREILRVLKPGGMLFVCLVRRSGFGTFIQLRWRTWAVTEQQGLSWLQACNLENIGSQPIRLGCCAVHGSTAFWGQKPPRPAQDHETVGAATNLEVNR